MAQHEVTVTFVTGEEMSDSMWMDWVEEAMFRAASMEVTVIDVSQEEVQ